MLKSIKNFYLSIFLCSALPQSSAATEILTTLDEHRDALTQVLENAKKRVIIVSPYITTYAISSDDLISKIGEAQGRGVEVVIYTDNRLDTKDGALKPTALEGRKQLAQAITGLFVAKKIHAKVLISDDDEITVGSFNWLSALRDEANQYSNHEQSIRVTGASAAALIEKSIKGLDTLEMIENEYSKFYQKYKELILPYIRKGERVDPDDLVTFLGEFGNHFHVYDHQHVLKLTEEMDSHGHTSDEQLQWLSDKLEEMNIVPQIHQFVVDSSFQ